MNLAARIEHQPGWDGPAGILRRLVDDTSSPVARALRGRAGALLRGEPLGHAAHPLMTDLPIGCWTSSALLDLLGGRSARPASRRLVALGLLTVVPTVATGLAELPAIDDVHTRRVAAAHASGNAAATLCYLGSWRARSAGRHLRGVVLGLAGGTVASVTGYLGGHLAFARGIGDGERDAHAAGAPASTDGTADLTGAAGILDVTTGDVGG